MSDFPWPLLAAFTTVLVFFGGILVKVISKLIESNQRHSDRRFESIEKAIKDKADAVDTLRADFSDYKLHAAERFITRDYFVQIEGSRSILLSVVSEELPKLKTDMASLSTLIHERLPAGPRN